MFYLSALRRVARITLATLGLSIVGTAFAADYAQVRQPAWEDMCMRGDQPMNYCSSFAGPSQLAYSRQLEAELRNVSDSVNARYKFSSDRKAYGVNDYWTYPKGGVADCEDYVLAKIYEFHQAGYAVSAMRIVIGQLSNGAWHAVLGVKTDQGTIHLDSLNGMSHGFQPAFYLDLNNTSSWRIAR